MYKTIIPAFSLTVMVVPALSSANWMADLPAALEQAANEKLVLVDFNASDWCGPCIKFKKQVLNTADLSAQAKEKCILVDIKLSRRTKMAPTLLQTNKALAKQYAVSSYPSVLVMNTDSVVVGVFNGGIYDMSVPQKLLNAVIANAAKLQVALTQASALSAAQKKKARNAAYQMLPAEFHVNNAKLMSETKTPDAEDSSSVKNADAIKADPKAESARIMSSLKALHKDPVALLKFINKELANETQDEKLRTNLNWAKLNAMLISSESLKDIESARVYALSFAKTSPNPEKTRLRMAQVFAQPAKLLERVKISRDKYVASLK